MPRYDRWIWALKRQTENGWLATCCLDNPEHPLTHTLGYALRGIVGAYLSSKKRSYLQAACRTADGLLNAQMSNGALPGSLDAGWRWVCLTGVSQIAHCWLLAASGNQTRRRQARRARSECVC
jgi:alkylhydroperoxidase family enzyme